MGKSSLKVTIVNWNVGGINEYYVGGITGYTSGHITGNITLNNATINGGKVLVSSSVDSYAFNCAGGIVGYKNFPQEANGWSASCSVTGYDNVGGIIGYNKQGNIKNITSSNNNNNVYGSGENVGGIVGLNEGGDIEICTNSGTVTGVNEGSSINYAENVGGIVGLNYNKNITDCTSSASVTGDKNVGGIAGIAYGGTIEYCGNQNAITGKSNTNHGIENWYYTGPDDCTGTGGITGKNLRATITKCYNNGKIICNFNGGGITGLINGGKIEYSYNTASITNYDENAVLVANRLGGIAGAGNKIYINSCYNVGSITGMQDINILSNGIGGIIGTVVDNSWFLYLGKEEIFPSNKYFQSIEVSVLEWGETENNITNCYSCGIIKGGITTGEADYSGSIFDKARDFIKNITNPEDALNHMCGIAGTILWAPNENDIVLSNNYYYIPSGSDKIIAGARDSWSKKINGGVTLEETEGSMKNRLYSWASKPSGSGGLILPETTDTYIYNTTAPVETDKGYKGYGILWWQLNDYVKLTSDMFMCSRKEGKEDSYINFPNANYNQTIHINNSSINFKNVGFNSCRIESGFEQPVKSSGCYRWIMMIQKGTYTIKGTTDFSQKSILFVNNRKQVPEGEEYSVNIQNNTQLHIAPIITFISAELNTENITVVWDRRDINVNAEDEWFSDWYDVNHNKIRDVRGYYDLDPGDSKATIKNGGKSVSVYLDKYDQYLKNQPIRFYRFEYYTRKWKIEYPDYWYGHYVYYGPNVVEEGTIAPEKANANQASCTIYINVQNLVDLLGDDAAKNYIPHTAQVNMDYNINMWFDAGDFGSLWTNAFNLKDSNLSWNISIQKYENGNWKSIQALPYGKSKKVTNDNSEEVTKFNKDGYYSIFYGVDSEDISSSLSDVKYDDELRIAIYVVFKSKSAHSYFNVDSAKLDITYGPDINF